MNFNCCRASGTREDSSIRLDAEKEPADFSTPGPLEEQPTEDDRHNGRQEDRGRVT